MRRVYLAVVLPVILAGCATSGKAVKDHNLINVFYADMPHPKTAGIVADMSSYCSSGLFDVEHNDLNNIGVSTVDLKNKHANHYYLHVEVEAAGSNKSKVAVYHFQNTRVTREMGKAVESWVLNNSKVCVPGF